MKIQQITELEPAEAEITEKLSAMDRQVCFYCLELD
jgi:hypothetical protein